MSQTQSPNRAQRRARKAKLSKLEQKILVEKARTKFRKDTIRNQRNLRIGLRIQGAVIAIVLMLAIAFTQEAIAEETAPDEIVTVSSYTEVTVYVSLPNSDGVYAIGKTNINNPDILFCLANAPLRDGDAISCMTFNSINKDGIPLAVAIPETYKVSTGT